MVFIFLKMRRAPSFDSKIILKSDLSREKRQLIEDLKRRRPVVRLPQLSQKGKRVKIEFFLNSGAAAIEVAAMMSLYNNFNKALGLKLDLKAK